MKLAKHLLPLLILFALTISISAQSAQQAATRSATTSDGKKVILHSDGTWKYAETDASSGTLTIEAGIVYKYDGAQPLARAEFFLLEKEPTELLKTIPLAGNMAVVTSVADALVWQGPHSYPEVWAALKPLIKYAIVTDFQGKATVTDIKPGKYWLYGWTPTRSKFAVWDLEVDIKVEGTSVILDQRNAGLVH